jgi:glycyl-tRNA synthetase beta chain
VSNISPDTSFVIGGNERVVRPRLADASFSLTKTARGRSNSARRVGQSGLSQCFPGTQGEVERVRAIAEWVAEKIAQRKSCRSSGNLAGPVD